MKKELIIVLVVVAAAVGFYLFNEQKKKKEADDKKKKEDEDKKKATDQLLSHPGDATLGTTYGTGGGSNLSPTVPLSPPAAYTTNGAPVPDQSKSFDQITPAKSTDDQTAMLAKLAEDNAKAQAATDKANADAAEKAAAAKKKSDDDLAAQLQAEADAKSKADAEANLVAQKEAQRVAAIAAHKKVVINPITALKNVSAQHQTVLGKGFAFAAAPVSIIAHNPVSKTADNMWSGVKADGSKKTVAGNVIGKVVSAPIKIAEAPIKALANLFHW